ncbi:amino acid ABC transporter permease [Bordetella genomosp. 8]|uniref:Glutamate/aspartate import permease protein GltK n=1 Tax=Bordetella genomosp. 8 TaxID=1416806 RepID=A0A1W6YTB4_9BORD|nr:amino acid ABC transporter permease [Bordetella genomosp. 8]ARP84228.1 amino acid ABC transporter permease [Bordetella genomosp. 8]
MSFDIAVLNAQTIRDYVLKGLLFSVTLTFVATVGGIILGSLIAMMRLSGRRFIRNTAAAYVNVMRSIPLVMVILWVFLLIPLLIGRPIGANLSAFLTYIAFEAAYFSEIVRSGLRSVPPGQMNASSALGLTYRQSMVLIILPQALRNMLPVLLTQVIVLFQDTSLVYAIGAYDLLKGFETIGKVYGRPIEAYSLATAVYFVISLGLSRAAKRLGRPIPAAPLSAPKMQEAT